MTVNGNQQKSTKIIQNSLKPTKIDDPNQPKSTKTTVKNAPRAPKIRPRPSKIIHFLLHSKGVAGVAAGVVNPATPWCRDRTHRIGIFSLLFRLQGPCAFRRARWTDGSWTPFGPPKPLPKGFQNGCQKRLQKNTEFCYLLRTSWTPKISKNL